MMENTSILDKSRQQLALMHRDAHFGGSFEVMRDYYLNEGKGILPEIDIALIDALALEEASKGINLALDWLTLEDLEEVKKAKEAYKGLRALCEVEKPKNPLPALIAHLVLSEEEEPTLEIDAIVKEKTRIVPLLINLLRSEEMHNPLFPGYGQAPGLAAHCLGLIGDKSALIALFESIGEGDFFEDETTIKALATLGEPAKKFLLKVVQKTPVNIDNERAAIAMLAFKNDEEVAKISLELLQNPSFQNDPVLTTYLILACEGLKIPEDREFFIHLSGQFSLNLHVDFQTVIDHWRADLGKK